MARLASTYAPILVRLAMSGVFLWFGVSQLVDLQGWTGWLPAWAFRLPIQPTTLVLLNGSFEVTFGILLVIGYFTRWVALLLTLHLLSITLTVGYNDVGIRDLGLSLATLSVALHGPDQWTFDMRKPDLLASHKH